MSACDLIGHRWSGWSSPRTIVIHQAKTVGCVVYPEEEVEVYEQSRTCTRCGHYERRLTDLDGEVLTP